jgi:hypothetical protein
MPDANGHKDAARRRAGGDEKPHAPAPKRAAAHEPATKEPATRGSHGPAGGRGEKAGTAPPHADAAIVYLPPLGATVGGSIQDLATRIAAVLDGSDEEATHKYFVEDSEQSARFGRKRPKATCQSVAVVKKSNDDRSSMDIYEFDYSTSFSERFDRKSTLAKSLSLLGTVGMNLGRLTASLVAGRSKAQKTLRTAGILVMLALLTLMVVYYVHGPTEKWVWLPLAMGALTLVLFAGLVFALYKKAASAPVGGAGLAGCAAVGAGILIVEKSSTDTFLHAMGYAATAIGLLCLVYVTLKAANSDLGQRVQLLIGGLLIIVMASYGLILLGAVGTQAWSYFDKGKDPGVVHATADPLTGIALALSAFGVTFVPKKARRRLNDLATQALGAVRYLAMGEGRDAEVGRLYELIEYLSERGYKSIDLVAYSFGSIVALDAIYPASGAEPPRRVVENVGKLVTIGCPAKTVGTFWPHFWEGRATAWNHTWINVYSPYDVLSSRLTTAPPANDRSAPAGVDPKIWLTPKDPGAPVPQPTSELVFNSGPSTADMSPGQQVLLGGLRAHANYWDRPFDDDRGAVALFAQQWGGHGWGAGGQPGTRPRKVAAAEVAGRHHAGADGERPDPAEKTELARKP